MLSSILGSVLGLAGGLGKDWLQNKIDKDKHKRDLEKMDKEAQINKDEREFELKSQNIQADKEINIQASKQYISDMSSAREHSRSAEETALKIHDKHAENPGIVSKILVFLIGFTAFFRFSLRALITIVFVGIEAYVIVVGIEMPVEHRETFNTILATLLAFWFSSTARKK